MNPLITERTALHFVELGHVDRLAELWLNPEVRQFLGGVVPADQARQKITTYIGLATHRAVMHRKTDEILGILMLAPRDQDFEISYLFFPEYWGFGYARESTAKLIEFGFQTVGCKRIVAVTQSQNLRSIALLKTLGMELIATFVEFSAEQSQFALNNPTKVND